jgi:hypothetical protein
MEKSCQRGKKGAREEDARKYTVLPGHIIRLIFSFFYVDA